LTSIRPHLKTIVYAAFILWAVFLVSRGGTLPPRWQEPLPSVVTILALLVWLFDRYLWKLPPLYRWFVPSPNLDATFQGSIETLWKDPTTGVSPGAIEAYLVVRQRYSTVSVRLFTKESSSEPLTASFTYAPDGTWTLASIYRNTPSPFVIDRSRPHYGGLILSGHQRKPTQLLGRYWTDRPSGAGELRLSSRTPKHYDTFEGARAAFSASSTIAKVRTSAAKRQGGSRRRGDHS
jgi:SMODS-associating 2TM, beta-strand rich effector domain